MNDIEQSYQHVYDTLLDLLVAIGQIKYSSKILGRTPHLTTIREFMEWIYTLGLLVCRQPDLQQTTAFQQYLQVSAARLQEIEGHRWIEEFTHELEWDIIAYDADAGGHYLWRGTLWRLSAIRFFIDLYQNVSEHHSTVFLTELTEIEPLVASVHRVEFGYKDEDVPEGIPFEHWWWWEEGPTSNRSERRPYVHVKPERSLLTFLHDYNNYYWPPHPDHLKPK